jgi:hypothetical protein
MPAIAGSTVFKSGADVYVANGRIKLMFLAQVFYGSIRNLFKACLVGDTPDSGRYPLASSCSA